MVNIYKTTFGEIRTVLYQEKTMETIHNKWRVLVLDHPKTEKWVGEEQRCDLEKVTKGSSWWHLYEKLRRNNYIIFTSGHDRFQSQEFIKEHEHNIFSYKDKITQNRLQVVKLQGSTPQEGCTD